MKNLFISNIEEDLERPHKVTLTEAQISTILYCMEGYISGQCRDELDEQFDRVEVKLRELPIEDQRIIRLKFEENKSYREISRIMNTQENSMGTRYSRALSKLRSKLA